MAGTIDGIVLLLASLVSLRHKIYIYSNLVYCDYPIKTKYFHML
jgi:hypothetical protein